MNKGKNSSLHIRPLPDDNTLVKFNIYFHAITNMIIPNDLLMEMIEHNIELWQNIPFDDILSTAAIYFKIVPSGKYLKLPRELVNEILPFEIEMANCANILFNFPSEDIEITVQAKKKGIPLKEKASLSNKNMAVSFKDWFTHYYENRDLVKQMLELIDSELIFKNKIKYDPTEYSKEYKEMSNILKCTPDNIKSRIEVFNSLKNRPGRKNEKQFASILAVVLVEYFNNETQSKNNDKYLTNEQANQIFNFLNWLDIVLEKINSNEADYIRTLIKNFEKSHPRDYTEIRKFITENLLILSQLND
jgi:hypothetical protein